MTVETATQFSELNPALPAIGDLKREAPQHFSLIKTLLKDKLGTLGTTALVVTAEEINYLDGVTSAVQTQLNTLNANKADTSGETYTGTHDFTAGTLTAATQSISDSSNKVATMAALASAALSTALPGQAGNALKTSIRTDGTNASWGYAELKHTPITTNTTAEPGRYYDIRTPGIILTIPATFVEGDPVGFGYSSGVNAFNTTLPQVDWTTNKVKGRTPGVMSLTGQNNHATVVYANSTDGFMEV